MLTVIPQPKASIGAVASVGIRAGDVACNATTCVAAGGAVIVTSASVTTAGVVTIASVVDSGVVAGVTIILSLPFPVGRGAWDVAHQATTAARVGVPVIVTGVPVAVVVVAATTTSTVALLIAGLSVGINAWNVALGILIGRASPVAAVVTTCMYMLECEQCNRRGSVDSAHRCQQGQQCPRLHCSG